MKKQLSKVLMVLITISMVFSLLQVQFASATPEGNLKEYAHYGKTEADLATYVNPEDGNIGWKGHVFNLEKVEDNVNYNYKLTVGVYNMDAANILQSSWRYDSGVIDLVRERNGSIFNNGTSVTNYIEYATIDDSMTSDPDEYGGSPLNSFYMYDQTTEHIIQKEEDNNYFDVEMAFTVDNKWDGNESAWTTKSAENTKGSEMFTTYGATTRVSYKYPEDKVYPLYTLYFKLKDESNPITSSTFEIYYNSYGEYHGGLGKVTDDDFNNEGVFFIGDFVEPEADPVNITFSNVQDQKDNSLLSGATVTLYTDSDCTTAAQSAAGVDLTASTTDGSAMISGVPANKNYYYKVIKEGYIPVVNSVPVGLSDVTVSPISLTAEGDYLYEFTVNVTDADTESALSGAAVKLDNVVLGETAETGQLSEKPKANTGGNPHSIEVSKEGYDTQTVEVTVTADNQAVVNVALVPTRVQVNFPQIQNAEGQSVEGAKFRLEKISTNPTLAWDKEVSKARTTTVEYLANTSAELPPETTFKMTAEADGYSGQTLYLQTTVNDWNIYSDESCSQAVADKTDAITVKQIGEPYYKVSIEPDSNDANTYIATVTLNNIKANHGTFGLSYDKEMFSLDPNTGVTLDSEIEMFENLNPAVTSPVATNAENSDDKIGYYVFTWHSADDDGSGEDTGKGFIDTTSAPQTIATYKFTLNTPTADINSATFSVMQYHNTKNAVDYITANTKPGLEVGVDAFLSELWRYTDVENNPESLGEGRLDKVLAQNGGFYQVYKMYDENTDDGGYMADVMTIIDIKTSLTALTFEAVDEAGLPIKDANISLSLPDGTAAGTLKTDTTGMVSTTVDVTDGDVTYSYNVKCNGYWDEPESGTEPTVEVKKADPPVTAYKKVILKEKIYHEPKLVELNNNSTLLANAVLTGDEYGYNGRDFCFNIKPDQGYIFDESDPIKVTIGSTEYMAQLDKTTNMFVVPGSEINTAKTGTATDSKGFPSDDIIIEVASSRISQDTTTYTVKAIAGTNGSVSYAGASDPDVTVTDNQLVEVKNITNDGTGSTKEFTFTPDSGYVVEKVIVNGVELTSYQDAPEVKYIFENITQDCSITVTFWKDNVPSTDSSVTLVVSDRGSVDVTNPAGPTGITDRRESFVLANGGTFEFSTQADAGYALNSVATTVNNGAKTQIQNTSGNTDDGIYSVTVNPGDKVVIYVTFNTYTVYVESYVVQGGQGIITPVGINSCIIGDKPSFVLDNDGDLNWKATGVLIDEVNQIDFDKQYDNYTYTFDTPIIQDTKIGAIFSETEYIVHGIVDTGLSLSSATEPKKAAQLTFTRTNEDGTTTVINETTQIAREAHFDVALPQGTWTLLVKKNGCLDYEISGFEVENNPSKADIYFGDPTNTAAKPIVLTIGDTSWKGLVVSLQDAGVVGNALYAGKTSKIYAKGDVDDDESVDVTTDMAYVKNNYGELKTIVTYDEFMAN